MSTELTQKNNEVSVIDRSTDSRRINNFMNIRNMKIVTMSDYSSSFPDRVGLSILITGSSNGKQFETSKTKSIKVDKLDNIRKALDNMGTKFTNQSMERTSDMSFKKLLNSLLDHVLSNEFTVQDNEDED